MVRTFLKVYMELGSYFLFLQEQVKDIIIIIFKTMPSQNTLTTSPTPTTFTSLHTFTSTICNPRHLDDSTVYHSIL